jgi:hypothetical protein
VYCPKPAYSLKGIRIRIRIPKNELEQNKKTK